MTTALLGQATIFRVSREDAELLVRTSEDIISFSEVHPVEFQMYCPPATWQEALLSVGTAVHAIERQLANLQTREITVPREAIFALFDLEECVAAARMLKLRDTRAAWVISAVGGIAGSIFGWPILATGATAAGLMFLFGRPLLVGIQGAEGSALLPEKNIGRRLGDHSAPGKVLQRILVPETAREQHYPWGDVIPRFSGGPTPPERAYLVTDGTALVRVEGWDDTLIRLKPGWHATKEDGRDRADIALVSIPAGREPSAFGPIPEHSPHEESFWVEYVGPRTGTNPRRVGPFG